MTTDFLTATEIERVIMESLKAAGADGLTDDEMSRACTLVEQMALKAATFSLWQEKELTVGYDRHEDVLRWYAVEK